MWASPARFIATDEGQTWTTYRFAVDQVLAGELGPEVDVRIRNDADWSGPTVRGIELGGQYALMIQEDSGRWVSGSCAVDVAAAVDGYMGAEAPQASIPRSPGVASDGLLLVVGGVMLATFGAMGLGLMLGRRTKKGPRKPRRNMFAPPDS